jgi:hypothetical protein
MTQASFQRREPPAPTPDTRFDIEPQEALSRIQSHRGPVLVDLDETLYLRNSTEDFISSAWPGPLAFLLIKVLDLLAPWRLSGGRATRDVWRVAAISLLMPWTLLRWRYRAPRLTLEYTNQRLLKQLQACRGDLTIITLGFRHVVAPLVNAMNLGGMRVVAMSGWHVRDRREGKLALARRALGDRCVGDALLVTDSLEDLDVLKACAQPLRVVWPEARYRDAFADTYVPGRYISRVKRPGAKYISRGIVSDEFVPWVLASIGLAAVHPVLHITALALLAVSFWAIYEDGYVDNDRIADRYEKDPVLTQAFFERPVYTSSVLPWLWAAGAGIAGLWLLRWPGAPLYRDILAWTALLLLTCGVFRLYNRTDKQTRVWLYAVLQVLRTAAIVVVVPVMLVGMMALAAHALARWVPYYIYRLTGSHWRGGDVGMSRLLFFVVLCVLLAAVEGSAPLWSITALALLLWLVFKARRELITIARQARWITGRDEHPADASTPAAASSRSSDPPAI